MTREVPPTDVHARRKVVAGGPAGYGKNALTEADRRDIIEKIGTPAREKRTIDLVFARKMLSEGWSLRQVAEWFSVSVSTVKRRMKGS